MACAEDTYVRADLHSVADYHEACVENCQTILASHTLYKEEREVEGRDKLHNITPIIRQKRRLHERPITNLPNDPSQHLQSFRENLVVRDCFRVEGVVLGCHAAAHFEEFRGIGVVPGFFFFFFFLLVFAFLYRDGRARGGREGYNMPEIMASYCSHMGIPLRSCARAMISGRLWGEAILLFLRWDTWCWCWYCGGVVLRECREGKGVYMVVPACTRLPDGLS